MRFSKQIKKKNVFCSLESDDRDGAIREIVARLMEGGEIAEDQVQPLVDGLLARERLGSTGIGKGIAIPHVRHEGIDGLLIAVGRSDRGLDFAAIDGEAVRVVFLIVAPEAKQDEYLQVLRWVSMAARDEYHNKLLTGASTPAGFIPGTSLASTATSA